MMRIFSLLLENEYMQGLAIQGSKVLLACFESQDDSVAIIRDWMHRFSALGIAVVFTQRAESAVTCVHPSCEMKTKK